jgi:hypothetical protein
MSDMKLIMENWKNHLAEEELSSPEVDDEQKKALEEFFKSIMAISLGADAGGDAPIEPTDAPTAETEETLEEAAAAKQARKRKKARQARTRQWKEMAGLTGVKIDNFTPEQMQLYQQAKEEFAEKEQQQVDQAIFTVQHTIANGNLLEVPGVKQIVQSGGTPLKVALTAVMGACANEVTLTCLTNWLAGQAQGM